jgi:hypothetical protein
MVAAGSVAVCRTECMIRKSGNRFSLSTGAHHLRRGHAQTTGWDPDPTEPNRITVWSDGSIMRRVIAIAATAITLGGCSSFSTDYFKPTPPTMQIQLESTPPGAEARTSIGPSCKTPCSVTVVVPEGGFSVSYTLNQFQPVTIPVQVSGSPGNFFAPGTTKVDPNPVVAQLQPIVPPKSVHQPMRPKRPKKPKNTAAAPPAAESAFPDPGQAAPPPR